MSDKSCEERIDDQLRGRLEDFNRILVDSGDDDKYDEAMDEWLEYPLSVEGKRFIRVELSTGGPGDWLDVHYDGGGLITRIEYYFNDWFDGASVVLVGEDFEIAEQFCQRFIDWVEL